MGATRVSDRVDAPPETSRFQIVRRLGAGGMGVVYEALDRLRGTRVALKTLRRLSPEALLRFKNEFRALQDLQHPNLVRLGELIADGNQWFFTMELRRGRGLPRPRERAGPGPRARDLAHPRRGRGGCRGRRGRRGRRRPRLGRTAGERTLGADAAGGGARLRRGAPAPALAQLAHGLAALHAAGKVHRDIKPSNILVTPEGRVVLLDFGVIADVRRGTDGHVVGTPLYMAPEQAACARSGRRPTGTPSGWCSTRR